MDLKQAALSTCTIVFVLSSMLGIGLGLRVSEIVAPLRNGRLVALVLVANFVVMPAVALALARLLRLDASFAVGLMVLPHGDHGRLHSDRAASAAAGYFGEPGADRPIARAADAAALGG